MNVGMGCAPSLTVPPTHTSFPTHCPTPPAQPGGTSFPTHCPAPPAQHGGTSFPTHCPAPPAQPDGTSFPTHCPTPSAQPGGTSFPTHCPAGIAPLGPSTTTSQGPSTDYHIARRQEEEPRRDKSTTGKPAGSKPEFTHRQYITIFLGLESCVCEGRLSVFKRCASKTPEARRRSWVSTKAPCIRPINCNFEKTKNVKRQSTRLDGLYFIDIRYNI